MVCLAGLSPGSSALVSAVVVKRRSWGARPTCRLEAGSPHGADSSTEFRGSALGSPRALPSPAMLRSRAECRHGAGVGSQGCSGCRAPPQLEHRGESQGFNPPREPGVPAAGLGAPTCLPVPTLPARCCRQLPSQGPLGCSAVLPFPPQHRAGQRPVGSPGLLRSQPGMEDSHPETNYVRAADDSCQVPVFLRVVR